MNISTIAILIVLAVLVILAVRRIRRKKLLFSCGGDCSSCRMDCKARKNAP